MMRPNREICSAEMPGKYAQYSRIVCHLLIAFMVTKARAMLTCIDRYICQNARDCACRC